MHNKSCFYRSLQIRSTARWALLLLVTLALTGCELLESLDTESDTDVSTTRPRTDAGLSNTDDLDADTDPTTPSDDIPENLKARLLGLSDLSEHVWNTLEGATNLCDPEWGYTLPWAGMFSFYCHVIDEINYAQLEELIEIPIFLSGPHQNGELNRSSSTSFGHYNPLFVKTLSLWAIPALKYEAIQLPLQYAYQGKIQILARTYWASYLKLQDNPEYWEAQKGALAAAIDNGHVPDDFYDKFYYFMNPGFIENADNLAELESDGGYYDGNMVRSATGFWIRRAIDNTAEDFADNLKQLMLIHDRSFVYTVEYEYPFLDIDENDTLEDNRE